MGIYIFIVMLCLPFIAVANPHGISFPKHELDRAHDAIEAIRDNKPEKAIKISASLKNQDIKRVVEWAIYKSPGSPVSPDAIFAFAAENPSFPELGSFSSRAEEAFFEHTEPTTKQSLAFFTQHPPVSARGIWSLANAQLTEGKEKETAITLLKQAWHSPKLLEPYASALKNKYGHYLDTNDHIKRIDALLWENKISLSTPLLPLVGKDYQKLFKARITLQQSGFGVDSAVTNVPKELVSDLGFIYDRVRWRERKELNQSAISLLKTVQKSGEHPYSHLWWNMRKRLIREAIKQKQYKSAYELANNHHATKGGIEFAEEKWLAGWISARFQHDPRKGYEHFYQMYQHVSYPISLARASYWAGKTASVNGNVDIAQSWYRKAAQHPLSFYGQLAMVELDDKPTLTLPPSPEISNADQDTYQKLPLVRAIHALTQMEEHGLAKDFIIHAIEYFKSPATRALISRIGNHYKQTHLSVYAARTANQYDTPLIQAGYPVFPMDYTIYTSRALAQAITLQESRFENKAASHAGAQGLMQLMPATARRMAGTLHEKYHRSKLVYDPEFNVRLGSFYLSHLERNFDGNLVLAIASYNAGPGNTRKWIETYGNPRTFETIDQVVDWIELIPFSETRNYVQRVIENMQIYRSVSGSPSLMIKNDLISKR